ncbi:hypothetical protein, partial [Nonomuraea dietziae]|uniref:hypothetical protein n=1 Tax=Nonomuraea dietziae TaxID=65515 RepID=UPI0033E8268F
PQPPAAAGTERAGAPATTTTKIPSDQSIGRDLAFSDLTDQAGRELAVTRSQSSSVMIGA